jgi:hypothetical protein
LRIVFLLLRPDFGYYPVSFCCHIALTATSHLSPTFPRVITKVLQKRCGCSYPGPQGRWVGSGRNLRTRCNILSASATTRPCAVNLEIPTLYRSHPFQRSSQNLVKSLWESSPLQAAVSAVPMYVPWLRGWCPASFGATKSHSFQCLTTCRSIQFSQLIE